MATKKATKKKYDTNASKNRKKNLKQAAKELKPKSGHDLLKGKLSPAEEKFCWNFASHIEFFGNGTQSYIDAFNVEIIKGTNKKNVPEGKKGMTIEAVRTAAKELLTSPHILTKIEEVQEETGFNDTHADKTLSFLMTQRADLRVALGAASEYNKLKARIVNRESHMHHFATEDMTDEELMERIKKKRAFFNKE